MRRSMWSKLLLRRTSPTLVGVPASREVAVAVVVADPDPAPVDDCHGLLPGTFELATAPVTARLLP